MEYLNSIGLPYEFRRDPKYGLCLVIRGFTLPERYKPRTVDFLVRIPGGYPNAMLDMFWVFPPVACARGGVPRATNEFTYILDERRQRFSRHMTRWRPGIDCLATFMSAMARVLENDCYDV